MASGALDVVGLRIYIDGALSSGRHRRWGILGRSWFGDAPVWGGELIMMTSHVLSLMSRCMRTASGQQVLILAVASVWRFGVTWMSHFITFV